MKPQPRDSWLGFPLWLNSEQKKLRGLLSSTSRFQNERETRLHSCLCESTSFWRPWLNLAFNKNDEVIWTNLLCVSSKADQSDFIFLFFFFLLPGSNSMRLHTGLSNSIKYYLHVWRAAIFNLNLAKQNDHDCSFHAGLFGNSKAHDHFLYCFLLSFLGLQQSFLGFSTTKRKLTMPRMTEKCFRVELGKLVVQDFSNQAAYIYEHICIHPFSVTAYPVLWGCWSLSQLT